MKTSNLDAMQGNFEQPSKAYKWYVERVAQKLTPQCAKSASGISGNAGKQRSAIWSFQ